jgi:hypothetical protein
MSIPNYTLDSVYNTLTGAGTISITFPDLQSSTPEMAESLLNEQIAKLTKDLPTNTVITARIIDGEWLPGTWHYELSTTIEVPEASDEVRQQLGKVLAVAEELGLNDGPLTDVTVQHSDSGWFVADPANAAYAFFPVSKDLGETQDQAWHSLHYVHEALVAVKIRHPHIVKTLETT